MILQRLARWTAAVLGRDRPVVRWLRPLYEGTLDLVTGGRGYVQTVNGLDRVHVNPRHRRYFPATYEPAVYRFLRASVTQGAVCLNVGAHVGVYAVGLAQWTGTEGRVIAFEPNPGTADLLEDYVGRNRLSARVTVVRSAVGEAAGEAPLVAAGVEGFSRLDAPHPEQAEAPARRITVPVTTIDAHCASHGLEPDWIVMDVEGYEVAALRGARRILAARGRDLRMVVEMHPTLWELAGASRDALEALLREQALEVTALTGQTDPLGEHGVVCLTPAGSARDPS